ncbi:MAG: glutamate racemase [Clostridia bacterium]|nr:glutamate racemase [Clostridia bacterium]
MSDRPIGVFDSGLGGLTVVRELKRLLPNEDIVYFGDTGRVPYGTRSSQTIEQYAREDESFLLSKNVKMIIAACGTVSSVAPHTGDELPVPFLGVVGPAADAAAKATKNKKIGVIGTSATIASKAYEKALLQHDDSFQITAVDCPLFVPIVESGWIDRNDQVAIFTAKRYLEPMQQAGVDTLILGCTHYPLLSDIIGDIMGSGVTLISAGAAAAESAAHKLKQDNLLTDKSGSGKYDFYVTDRPDGFQKIASLFLQEDIGANVSQVAI